MAIEKVIIQNFKKFKEPFEISFYENINFWLGITNLENLPFLKLFMWL
jgi:hypothetical protein